MFVKFIKWLCRIWGVQTPVEISPFSETVSKFFTDPMVPLFSIDFIRLIMSALNVGITEVEIILLLLAQDEDLSFDDIAFDVDHICEEHLKKLLRQLWRSGYITKSEGQYQVSYYGLTEEIRSLIKSIYK